MDKAQCVDMDVRVFYPPAGNTSAKATKICQFCPVMSECLEYSIQMQELYGVWGGMPERQRRKLIRSRFGQSVYYSTVVEEVG